MPSLTSSMRVSGAADALQPACHRRRRLDLDHEIDRAHVDAELERRGRDQRAQVAGLQQILDLGALRPGQRPVMRAHQRLAGQLVDAPARRSARRRLLTNSSVERCARISSSSRG